MIPKAYHEGWAAYFDGRPQWDNPYLPDESAHESWEEGWLDASAQFERTF